MKKYSFSEIKRCTWQNTFGKDKELIGKYICQVFNNNEYVKVLVGNTFKEVVELQKQFLKEIGRRILWKRN